MAILHATWLNPVGDLRFVQNGALMVDFFFVLSGFVIAHSYGQRIGSASDLARFAYLRFGRLYPLHLTFLLVFVGIELAKYVVQVRFGLIADKPAFTVNGLWAFVANALLIQSLGVQDSLTYNFPSWSISAEFYTYLLFGIVLLVCRRRRDLPATALLLVVASFSILRLAGKAVLEDAGYDYGFFRCTGSFFLGVLAYRAHQWLRRPGMLAQLQAGPGPRILTWGSLAATLSFLALRPEGCDDYALPVLMALLILSLASWPSPTLDRVLCVQPLAWLGKVSYSVYMSHAALAWGFKQVLTVALKQPKVLRVAGAESVIGTSPVLGLVFLGVYLVAVLAISDFTYRWIEEPFRRKSRARVARDGEGLRTSRAVARVQ